jgi:hypothetical protein
MLVGSLLVAAAAPSACLAQGRVATVYTRTDVRDLAQRMERHSDEFRKHFEKAIDNSSIDGTDREDRLRRWTQDLEDMMDKFREDYNQSRVGNIEQRVNTLLAIAAGINRILLYRPFDSTTHRDWNLLRADLNALAITYDLPLLQSYRSPLQIRR